MLVFASYARKDTWRPALVGVITILIYLLVAIALRWGLDPNDLKLITAVFVFAALVLPGFLKKLRRSTPVAA